MEGLVDGPFRSLDDDNDKDVKRQRLGELLATTPEEVVGEETSGTTLPHSFTKRQEEKYSTGKPPESRRSSEPKRMRTGSLRVSTVNELQKPSTRRQESIVEKDWINEDAIKIGSKILSGGFVDNAIKEKSRWCARDFATYMDPSVFAAASDVDNTSLIDLLPVKRVTASCVSTQLPHSVKLLRQSSSSRLLQITGRKLVNMYCGNA